MASKRTKQAEAGSPGESASSGEQTPPVIAITSIDPEHMPLDPFERAVFELLKDRKKGEEH
jgi:hypothetical protein